MSLSLQPPEPRSGHQIALVKRKLYVCGGWNSAKQFDDLYVLDTECWTWEKLGVGWGAPRWNHSTVGVFAVPYWKVFVFGGNSGDLTSGVGNMQGEFLGDLCVLDTGSNTWSQLQATGNKPCPRADTEIIYDPDLNRLILFGGWANNWFEELCVCDVGGVVGPPYALESISPSTGPITGEKDTIIRGMGFQSSTGTPTVRLSCSKGCLEVKGEVLSDSELRFSTPRFDKYGPVEAEVRVSIGSKSLTNTSVTYTYFSVCDGSQTIAFGPGTQKGFIACKPVEFMIQACDKAGNPRVCGGDEFQINITPESEDCSSSVTSTITDMRNGTYTATYTAPQPGKYSVSVRFTGTFGGNEGEIRGSPFLAEAVTTSTLDSGSPTGTEEGLNDLGGSLHLAYLQQVALELKSTSSKTTKCISQSIPKDSRQVLIDVRKNLKFVDERTGPLDLSVDASRAALGILKQTSKLAERILNGLESSATVWNETKRTASNVSDSIVHISKVWAEKTEEEIAEYEVHIKDKERDFRKCEFWSFDAGPDGGRRSLKIMEADIEKQTKVLEAKSQLCDIFNFPQAIVATTETIDQMKREISCMYELWDKCKGLQLFISESKNLRWSEVSFDDLEETAKKHMKAVQGLHKDMKGSSAYKGIEKLCKDFLITIPLISLLGHKAVRRRHWVLLQNATGKSFRLPEECPDLRLDDLLSLNLHELSADVEDIADQAAKEAKIESTLEQLSERWKLIEWLMEYYPGTDIPLLKISEDDFETLESDQLTIQGMLGSRYVKQFEVEAIKWKKSLGTTAEIIGLLWRVQQIWSYLEPLFIHSEEVKKELPEDAARFEGINSNVCTILKALWNARNILNACNTDGYVLELEKIAEQLESLKSSLAEFLDGRRRLFPRYYFVSESDLLDILSNGSTPEKVLIHIPKVYLQTKTLVLSDTVSETNRPSAVKLISGVGVEEMEFEPPVPLEGKVEKYMKDILDGMKISIFENVKRSLVRYTSMSRPDWIMHKHPVTGRPSDPAQVILLTLAIYYAREVEEALLRVESGDDASALQKYNQIQQDQLSDLIRLTQSDLSKADRTRVMVCITMDAHGRDVVQKMIREKVTSVSDFQWQSQLKHKWRIPPQGAGFQLRDPHLRGPEGERAEIAIADAILPYDYEYLGNGLRLVITPLTDRIYVTATQALNLKMGCAPAGPAGTGKTETTKDLANALAKCCYVFNCSPEMDYKGLGNIFKGLSSSGAWGCFDEFNRLIPEVLSVCSVQFKAVCDGVRGEVSRITVEGDEVTLDPTCGVFITMNPGYLGRSELPEGLKALFRPMTVMVPDLVLICENMLMSEGFVTAKVLASKFDGLYSLLRELLSKQMHYDWGLRAVKSVLVVAGAFKRAEPDLPEDALLMRALRDFNTPKIVQEDQVVFFGLLDDLFPGINPPRKVNEGLEVHVKNACTEMGKHPDPNFCLKVAQLDELLAIRHCVFIMGPPGAGKSQCWKTLAAAQAMRDPSLVTKVMDINPKSIQTEELYGYISMATREWKDGLLSHIIRDLGNIPDEKPKWILLDGDLDANWIESMNSVMDDNRMLTLASNERIPLKSHMRMIFEIRDLKYATPATVSRAGILYISTDEGTQWKSLIESWLAVRKEPPTTVQALRVFFEQYIAQSLVWMKINVKTVVPIENVSIVQVLLYMLDGMLDELKHVPTPEMLERVFVFCTVWAFGSTLITGDDGTDYRKIFSDWWRKEWTKIKFPSRETVFDYWLDHTAEQSSFEQWTKSPHFYSIEFDSRSMAMESVTVPTPETRSVTFWMKLLVNMRRPVMMVGPSGTGKTQMAKGMLQLLRKEGRSSSGVSDKVLSQAISFNFYTTFAALQRNMNLPLERKTGTSFGPPGNSRLVHFLDDINLPEVDPYNTQSAIALLRQLLEYEHVYDLSKMSVQNISNTQVLACLNPTAGSFLVNPRLQRWFATFAVGLPGPTSLLTIYETFLNGHLKHFDPSVSEKGSSLIKAALGLHAQVTANFRKTATNFHYEFNIRHLSSVFQGLLVAQPAQFSDPEKFIQLWLHESERVYGDRLVSLEELVKYNSLAQAQCKKQFPTLNVSRFYAEQNADPLIFCHFTEGVTEQVYEAVESMTKLCKVLEDSLREYNEVNVMMDLVLFEDAIKHVARIVRIMHNEGGHALLVGVGGSGKQSLARLAAFICGYSTKQIAISSTYSLNDFKDDLKAMYNIAGVRDEGIMFLFTDSQITNEKFLVFVNDLLATGEVLDLFTTEETDTIINDMTQKVKSRGLIPDRKNCWELFIQLVRKNLHVVLAFSPVGSDFRNRARKFPAIVSYTVIDWFQPWPQDALFSVGKKFLADLDLGSDMARGCIESFLPFSFEAVNIVARRFLRQEKRAVYTTPKSVLELLKLYRVLLASKRDEQEKAILRLDNGLLKLKETKDAVSVLEEDLKVKLENAEQKRSVAEGIAEAASQEKAVVEVETKKAQVEAEEVARIQTEVSIKQKDTEEDLAKAEPAVQAAMAALDTVNRKDLAECRTMSKPPAGVEDIFAATMILLAGNSPSVVVTKTGKVKDRSWDASKKQLLGDVSTYIDLLKGLKNKVDSNSIAAINWKEIRPLLELEHFNVPTISAKNSAAAGLCEFVLNIVQYHDIVITVEPKRKALAEANNQLEQANSRLEEVQSLVATLEAKLEKLTIELKTANEEKQEALDSVA